MKELEKFNPMRAEITSLVAPVLLVKVTDFRSSQAAIDSAKTIKEMTKRLDDLRREEVDPLNAKVKSVNEYVKQIKGPLDQAETHLRAELNAFAAQQEKIRQEEIRKADEEQKKKQQELLSKQEEERIAAAEGLSLFGSDESVTAAARIEIDQKHAVELAIQSTEAKNKAYDINQYQLKNTRKTTKVRVLDLAKVPKEFLIIELNEKATIAAYKGGVTEIPGLEFYQEIGVAIGQRTRATREAIESDG